MMSNQKDKAKNEGECESESGKGLVDLGLDEEADEQKIFEIAKEEENVCMIFLKALTKQFWKKNATHWHYYFLTQFMLLIKQKRS